MYWFVRNCCISLFVLFLLQVISSVAQSTYKAAVVEYHPVQDLNLTPEKSANKNAIRCIKLAVDLYDQGIDILVYPESVLTPGLLEDRKDLKDIAVYVPERTKNVRPCDNEDFPTYFQQLSCFANEMNSYLVVNLVEKENCNENTSLNSGECADDLLNFYNCDVVFDRNGTVIQRYRKHNLFDEINMEVTKEPEVATFATDFDVTFGLFTRFDILFENPSLLLVRQGVKHMIFPSMWSSGLPFLTALQVQNMFAVAHDVVVLAAGTTSASNGTGGTGIYQGGLGPIEYDIISNDDSKVYVQNVYKTWDPTTYLDTQVVTPLALVDTQGAEMDNFKLQKDNLSDYQYYLLTDEVIDKVFVINNEITCKLSWKATYQNTAAPHYQYVFFYYSGTTPYIHGQDTGIDVCGVVFCQAFDSNIFDYTKCGERYSFYYEVEWPFIIQNLSVVANFTNKDSSTHYPNTLMSNIRPLDRDNYEWSTQYFEDGTIIERSLMLLKPQKRLMTFAIYGRDLDRDRSASSSVGYYCCHYNIVVAIVVTVFLLK